LSIIILVLFITTCCSLSCLLISVYRSASQDVIQTLGAQHARGVPYHPESQGKVERENQTVKNMLNKMIMEDFGGLQPEEAEHGTMWAPYIPLIAARRNATPRRSLLGQTPYFVLYGKHSPITTDAAAGAPMAAVSPELHAKLVTLLADSQRKMKEKEVAARALKKPPTVFDVGDKVFVCGRPEIFSGKMIAKWSHFAVVVSVVGRRNSYIVRYAAGGGPYGEAEGTDSKLLPAKRLKKCAVTVSNAAFTRALRLSKSPAMYTAALTASLAEEDDTEWPQFDPDPVPGAVEVDDGGYESDDDPLDAAGTARSVFPSMDNTGVDVEYVLCAAGDDGAVKQACLIIMVPSCCLFTPLQSVLSSCLGKIETAYRTIGRTLILVNRFSPFLALPIVR